MRRIPSSGGRSPTGSRPTSHTYVIEKKVRYGYAYANGRDSGRVGIVESAEAGGSCRGSPITSERYWQLWILVAPGLIFMFLYNLYTSVLRGVGDSKTPLYFLIISSILNIVLDLVYVIQFGMGVRGVAVATVQSQAVSVILCIIYTNIRIPLFRLGLKDLRVDFGILRTVLRFGIPTAIQQSISAIGSMLVQGLVNSFGATAAAAFAAGNKVESFMMMPLINIAKCLVYICGAEYRRRKLDRVRDGFKER